MIEAILTCTHNLCFGQKYENKIRNQLKIVIFTVVKLLGVFSIQREIRARDLA